MAELVVCPNGHHWEAGFADDLAADDAELTCPTCGAAGQVCLTETLFAGLPATDDDLAPPPKPLPAAVARFAEAMQSSSKSLSVAVSEAPMPRQVAGYEIVRTLGRGGMGVVYEATHLQLGRVVALKMILSGAHASDRELVRFRSEAQACAQLQHPNIVQIYEVGEQAGCAYLALEYVEGGSLAHKLSGRPQPPRAAAQLSESLARAIQFAHERHIVHRDLKPGNVLLARSHRAEAVTLGPDPDESESYEPKITDFGLAKRLGADSSPTKSGELMGTPSYMAPEQTLPGAHEASPAADIYALGAILYELLTGRPPFVGVTSLETLRQVQSDEPVRPTRLQPAVPRDLETICLKCLQKEPHKRYVNASALADDLRRYLTGEPILARPISLIERGLKWAKRRPAVAALVLVSVVATVSLLAFGVWHDARLQVERDESHRLRGIAQRNEAEAWKQKEDAERAWRKEAERGRAYRRLARSVADTASTTEAIKLYKDALAVFKELLGKYPDDALYLQDLARSHYELGVLYNPLFQGFSGAVVELRKAQEIQERLARENPTATDYRQDLAKTYSFLGISHRDHGDFKSAKEYFEKALDIQEQLVRDAPENPEHRFRVSQTYAGLGLLLRESGQTADGEAMLGKARDLQEALSQSHPRESSYRDFLSRSDYRLGELFRLDGRWDEAEAAYRNAIAVREKLVLDYSKSTTHVMYLGFCYRVSGLLASDRGQPDEALDWYSKAIERMETVRQKEPKHTMNQRFLCRAYADRSEEFHRLNRPKEATSDWNSAVKLDRKLCWDRQLERAQDLIRLGKYSPAMAIASRLMQRKLSSKEWLTALTRLHSDSAESARRDERLTEADRERLADDYAKQAADLEVRAKDAQESTETTARTTTEPETEAEIARPPGKPVNESAKPDDE